MNLSQRFEPAIVFSIVEQVAAYRIALNGHMWIGKNLCRVKETGTQLTCSAGYIETMPPLDNVVRDINDASTYLLQTTYVEKLHQLKLKMCDCDRDMATCIE